MKQKLNITIAINININIHNQQQPKKSFKEENEKNIIQKYLKQKAHINTLKSEIEIAKLEAKQTSWWNEHEFYENNVIELEERLNNVITQYIETKKECKKMGITKKQIKQHFLQQKFFEIEKDFKAFKTMCLDLNEDITSDLRASGVNNRNITFEYLKREAKKKVLDTFTHMFKTLNDMEALMNLTPSTKINLSLDLLKLKSQVENNMNIIKKFAFKK